MLNNETHSDDIIFLKRHAEDLIRFSKEKNCNRFTSFLTENEQAAIKTIKMTNVKYAFFGGHDNSERNVFGVFGSDEILSHSEVFPVTTITFSFQAFTDKDKLSHRDFLGAFMNCGIKRETIGDILIGRDYCIVFCLENIAPLIISEVKKVGRVGVNAKIGLNGEIPGTEFSYINGIVSSVRLDSVVSIATKLSREKALLLIKSGAVKSKGVILENASKTLTQNTAFTIKGYGKFILFEIGNTTKKGRIHIDIKKYK